MHPFTLRADRLPDGVKDFTALFETVLFGAGGVFTDHLGQVVAFLAEHGESDKSDKSDKSTVSEQ
ncbi:hypothetical protein [Modicisalibacter muralis]|uniref:hypothetical protein n=1 Tax=Modicisalibacter muralis TaxID=119000 RepID=UPI001113CFE0|nr:hypothetical protein [Halomonas muralis]